jgi:hypothetical protein
MDLFPAADALDCNDLLQLGMKSADGEAVH